MAKSKPLSNNTNNNNIFAVLGDEDDYENESTSSSITKKTKKNKNNKSSVIESPKQNKKDKKNKKEKVSSDEEEEEEEHEEKENKIKKSSNEEKEKLDRIEQDRFEIPTPSIFNQIVTIFICILLTVVLYASPTFLGEFISLGGSIILALFTLYLIKELVMPVTKDVNKFKTLYVINEIQQLRKEKSVLKNAPKSTSNDKKLKYIKERINNLELEFEKLDSKNNKKNENNNNNNNNNNDNDNDDILSNLKNDNSNMGFFGFIGSLIVFLIKTPFLLAFFLLKLIFHPISILVGLIALYLYYTSGEKKDIPFVPKFAPAFNPKTAGSHSGTKGAKGVVKSKHG
ncbi:hypothetical protein DDB_G0267664 [Dictyostelium discoideum AX4]|uniref:Transmembrane protein n=1 Tax=Dictyostelium discoideum TaxID=44689 RepID=Q55GI0_DICDI|nr:hypothetical protein DDB_G0267664 [Dictyostelium discoideum AX4]EAL73285.1 hypothetical protein DDB_G0267664 [Dictyostelium discoideum AX4]|eukprot:XP_647204.1 hypothetical protein DDB_G0267664 [Dictyostelium discoideum AX4]